MCKYCDQARAQGGEAWLTADERLAAEACGKLERLPVMLLTGFLGAGKTSLLNRLLRESRKRLVVVENEVGQVGIDNELLKGGRVANVEQADEVVLMPNGCLCCRTRGDLRDALKRIVGRNKGIEGIILELSGLSELAPVVQTFFADQWVQSRLRMDLCVCLLDAKQLSRYLSSADSNAKVEELALVQEQLCLANVAIVNKIDLVRDPGVVCEWAQRVNPSCKVYECSVRENSCRLPNELQPSNLMGNKGFALSEAMHLLDDIVNPQADDHHDRHDHDHKHSAGATHFHNTNTYTSIAIEESAGPLDVSRFRAWMEETMLECYTDVFVRFKALLWTRQYGFDESVAAQGVYGQIEYARLKRIFQNSQKKSVLVFIGPLGRYPELEERIRKGVKYCLAEQDTMAPTETWIGKFKRFRMTRYTCSKAALAPAWTNVDV